jgi:hypothetical protein
MRVAAVLIAVSLAFVTVPAQSESLSLSDADRSSIRDVIESQLAAFQRDDGAQAFSYASPTVRRQFVTPERFMHMVRTGYPPVYRPREVEFRDVVVAGDVPAQKVLLVGPDGVPVMAIYPMQRQADGSWKIDGCFLVAVGDQAI